MKPLDLVKLTPLMAVTSGRAETIVGLIDGSVAKDHSDIVSKNIREIPGQANSQCTVRQGVACLHGTFVAGILCGKRGTIAPAICPDCTLLVRPIFTETTEIAAGKSQMPSATPAQLARAIYECVEAGARLLNLSAALIQPTFQDQRELQETLDYAARRGAIAVVAAGNQGTVGSSIITRHPGVIPVVACNQQGQPLTLSNLSSTIGRRGLQAPGENVTSLGANGKSLTLSGTSAAAPFVTGAVALLWSEFPTATAAQIKRAVTQADGTSRRTIMPPLLDAWGAYQIMVTMFGRR